MKDNKYTVLVVEPGKDPYAKEIEHGLKPLQNIVGDTIQAIYSFDDHVCIIYDDEGKLLQKTPNRLLRTDDGEIYDYIAGTFIIAGISYISDDFVSLSDELIEKYMKFFSLGEQDDE